MYKDKNTATELSYSEINTLIEKQTNRINRGIIWLTVGIFIMLATLYNHFQIISWGVILIGLREIINGNSRKSRYKKMLPVNLLPLNINCIKCGSSLELDMDERVNHKYICPICNREFSYIQAN